MFECFFKAVDLNQVNDANSTEQIYVMNQFKDLNFQIFYSSVTWTWETGASILMCPTRQLISRHRSIRR